MAGPLNRNDRSLPYSHQRVAHPSKWNPLNRIPWHWLMFITAFVLYVLTVIYASHPELVSHREWVGGSPSRAVLILAVLSGLATPMLSATIGHSVDTLRDTLAARNSGQSLLDNQLLQPGTGIEGLIMTLLRRSVPTVKARLWSAFRLSSMAVMLILPIIIFSSVDTRPAFYQSSFVGPAHGFGVGTFDPNLALIIQPLTDLIFSTRFKDILSDSDLTIDISEDSDRQNCVGNDNKSPCVSRYYIPGGIENYAPTLLADKNFTNSGDIQPVLAINQTGFNFEFQDADIAVNNTANYNTTSDCLTSGFILGAFQLCLKNKDANQIQSFISLCPSETASQSSCLNDSSWQAHRESGWGTVLTMYQRRADIGYNGLNGSILTHSFSSSPREAVNITAADLLKVYRILFNPVPRKSGTYGDVLTTLGLGANKPLLPLYIWLYFQGLSSLSTVDALTNRRAITGLQALLTIPIYHCQAKDFAELRRLLVNLDLSNNTAFGRTTGQSIISVLPNATADVDVYPAVLRYNLLVGSGPLIAYVVLGALTLLLCFAAQILGSCFEGGKRVQEMSSFTARNLLVDFEIFKGAKRAQHPDYVEMRGFSGRDNLERMEELTVYLPCENTGAERGEELGNMDMRRQRSMGGARYSEIREPKPEVGVGRVTGGIVGRPDSSRSLSRRMMGRRDG